MKRSQLKKIRIIGYILFLNLVYTCIYAQSASAPSPNVAAVNYGKYADVEPNLYTGSLSVPIDFGTISHGTVATNISIGYHTSGFRANELSSEIGLGWHLNAGGAVTRQIRGLDDFGSFGWLRTGDEVQGTITPSIIDDIEDEKIDPEPDLFTFQVNGMSGKFYFDTNGSIHTVPESDLRIEWNTTEFYIDNDLPIPTAFIYEYFLLTDLNGTKYYFGQNRDTKIKEIEYTTFNNRNSSAWFLNRIESHDGFHYIDFTYQDEYYQYYSLNDCGYVWLNSNSSCEMSITKVKVETKLLKTIDSETSNATFEYFDRTDLAIHDDFEADTPQRLFRFFLNEGEHSKKVVFQNAGYFFGNSDYPSSLTGSVDNSDKDELNKHLRLIGVDISGTGTETLSYDFTYYGTNEVSGGQFFPNSVNMAQDHWGYYNGASNNSGKDNIIPFASVNINGTNYLSGTSGVIRQTSFDDMVAGALEKMTLPTGAEITYSYEENKHGNSNASCGGLRVKEISTDDKHGNTIKRTYNYGKGQLYKLPQYGGTNTSNVIFNSRGFYGLTSFDGFHIGYEDVEIDYNGNGTKKIKYWTDTSPVNDDIYPPAIEEIRENAGSVQSEEIFGEDGNQIQYSSTALDNTYTKVSGDQMVNIEFYPNGVNGTANPHRVYKIHTKHFRLSETTQILDGVSQNKKYLYNASPKNSPSDILTYNSDGDVIKEEVTQWTNIYTGQNSTSADNYFEAKNIIIPWLNKLSLNFSGTTQETKTHYKSFGGFPFPYYPFETETKYFGIQGSGNLSIIDTTKYINYSSGMLEEMIPHGSQVSHTYEYYPNLTLKESCVGNLCSEYIYQGINAASSNTSRLLKEKIDVDGTSTYYTYDNLLRLSSQSNCLDSLTEFFYNIAQSEPYIKTTKTFGNDPTGLSDLQGLTSYQYLDGLGRTIQTVGQQQTFGGKDQISTVTYDDQGRIEYTYETFESPNSDGSYYSTLPSTQRTAHEYEASPLNRIKSIKPPEWDGKSVQTNEYGNNTIQITSIEGDVYDSGTLFKNTVIDGNENQSITYSDVRGRVIQNIRTNGSDTNITNYAYDTKNRVIEVVPPGSTLGDMKLNYFYKYDAENKIIEKSIPSKGVIKYKYDDRDLVIAQQDNHLSLRSTNKWYAYEYDAFGRETFSGFGDINGNVNLNLVTTGYYASGSGKGKISFNNARILNTSTWIYSNHFYDNCGRLEKVSRNNLLSGGSIRQDTSYVFYDGASNTTKTREKIRAGTSSTDERYVTFESHLDNDGRVIQEYVDLDTENQKLISLFHYTEKDQIRTKYQGGNTSTYLQRHDYAYMINGRLRSVNVGTSSGSDLYGYSLNYWQNNDVIGQTNAPIQARYNGDINSLKWAEDGQATQFHNYHYDYLNRLKQHYTSSDLYNSSYTYDDRGNFDKVMRSENGVKIDTLHYSYIANNSNQVSHVTDYGDKSLGYIDQNNTPYEYDENGNLKRDHQKELSVTYNHLDLPETINWDNGKRIEFSYDGSGNLWRKELYDGAMSLQKHDYIGSFEFINNSIYAVMHSEGRILNEGLENSLCYLFLDHQQSTNGDFDAKRIESIGNIITNSSDYEASECVEMQQGFEVKPGAEFLAHIGDFNQGAESWRYDYEIRDHIGNLRILYTGPNRSNLTILQRQDYHPYGMSYKKNLNTTLENKYQFNGIDYVGDFGLDWSMASYRNLDAALGSWGGPDPKSEAFKSMSPYCAMGANPISNVDPEGDLFFAIPSISFGSGGFGIGLEVGIGIPGVASASVGGNYNFSQGSASWYAQGTFSGAYAGYGTHGGYAGFGFNHGGANIGFNLNTSSGASFSLGIGGSQGSGSSGVGISLGESGLSWGGSASSTIYDEQLFPDLKLKRYTNQLLSPANDAYAYQDGWPPESIKKWWASRHDYKVDYQFEADGLTFNCLVNGECRPAPLGGSISVGPGGISKGYKYVKTIGNKYDVYQKVKKANELTGQARAVWTKIYNRSGTLIRKFKDAFRPDGRHWERANYKPHQLRSRKPN